MDHDYEKDKKAFDEFERKESRRQNKLIKRLKRSLKPKCFDVVELLKKNCFAHTFNVVDIESVVGSKERASEWFGESVAVRHLYDDTRHNSYSESTSGYIYLPVGKGRYLMIYITS